MSTPLSWYDAKVMRSFILAKLTPAKRVAIVLCVVAILALLGFLIAGRNPQQSEYVQPDPLSPVATSTSTSTQASTSTPTLTEQFLSLPSKVMESIAGPQSGTSAYLLKNMHLTFRDEFNSFSRYTDTNGNILCDKGGTGTWQTVYHFCSRTNPGNSEAEVYIDPTFLDYLNKKSPTPTSAKNPFTTNNGVLVIEAAPSDDVILSAVGPWAKYTSGMITTQFSFSQTYGYFEMRAKLPPGKGLWPAFWLLPTDATWPPEVDAMEAFGAPNDKGEGQATMIHYASHTVAGKKDKSCGEWHNLGVDLTKDFHTYGVDVEADAITYYFDGVAYAHCLPNPDTNKPFYMLVNLAVGGLGSWPGVPDPSTKFPAYMYVDYVRAYNKI